MKARGTPSTLSMSQLLLHPTGVLYGARYPTSL